MIEPKGVHDFLTDDEQRLLRYIDRALVYAWKTRPDGGRQLIFEEKYALAHFYDLVSRLGDHGYCIGAAAFMRVVADRKSERTVCSKVLTRLARIWRDLRAEAGLLTEASVAHFGRFVREIIGVVPRMVLEWVEDMDATDPERDLEPEPTAVIRGVLFSPDMDQRRAVKFWALAATSPLFPDRIFSDHCSPREGVMYTSYQSRAFAEFMSLAPVPAVERFAKDVLKGAGAATIMYLVADGPPVARPADPAIGRRILTDIVPHIVGKERQELVERIFAARPDDVAATDAPRSVAVHAAA